MRISLKTDYAVRAMAQLAAEDPGIPVKADYISRSQGIPLKFLTAILNELKLAYLVRSQRGPVGGYSLRKRPQDISLADIIRAIDGPLANVHDTSLDDLGYQGPSAALAEVWMAVRASLRSVLEETSLADLVSGKLPRPVRALAGRYRARPQPPA
ncbi:MAG: RrF2 family transcriptional regulator [Actinomycetota bacterium]